MIKYINERTTKDLLSTNDHTQPRLCSVRETKNEDTAECKVFYSNSIHIKNKIIVLTRAGLTLDCDPGQQHSSAPVQDFIRDAECLPACSWKAADPPWRASSQSCFVTGPHSSGPPGNVKAGKALTISTGKPWLIPSALILTA